MGCGFCNGAEGREGEALWLQVNLSQSIDTELCKMFFHCRKIFERFGVSLGTVLAHNGIRYCDKRIHVQTLLPLIKL